MTQHMSAQRKSPLSHDPEAVRWARESVGYTQAQLAAAVGISFQLMCDIEHGRRNATPATLNAMAKALNCPRSVLERKREDVTA